MISRNLDVVIDSEEEFSVPIDITDIIFICKEFNKLGYNIQNQMDSILEFGIEESIKSGQVKQEALPHIEDFLKKVMKNPYFGDATSQANDCIFLIRDYLLRNKDKVILN